MLGQEDIIKVLQSMITIQDIFQTDTETNKRFCFRLFRLIEKRERKAVALGEKSATDETAKPKFDHEMD